MFSRVLLFDKRGTGMSDRLGRISTLEERMDDIRAVMDACESNRAVIMGVSEGVALSILFAASHLDRTESLILYSGRASYVRQPDYPWIKSYEEQARVLDEESNTLFETWGTEAAALESINVRAPSAQHDREHLAWFAELMRLGASPGSEIARQRMNLEIDVRSVLPSVRVPTLVLNRVEDRLVNIEEARYIAERIPVSELVQLDGGDHLPWCGDQESLVGAIETFVTGPSRKTAPTERESVLATVAVIAMKSGSFKELEIAVAGEIERFRGRIASREDGSVSAVFDGPARAVRFVGAVILAVETTGHAAMSSVQCGEVVIDENGATGPAIEAAASLVGLAVEGEILANQTVRDLVAGSGIRFMPSPRGQTLAGEGPLQILVVDRASLG